MKILKMASAVYRMLKYISDQGNTLLKALYFGYPPEKFLPAIVNVPCFEQTNLRHNLTESWKESIVWAVPKKRRTIEKRRSRRFGIPDYFYKMLVPKTNILVCPKCGSYCEAGLLCATCYAKVKEETMEMQSAIEKNLGLAPAENEVVVLYQNDERLDPEFYKGKRIVEMKKDRPKLFSDNLMQRSTQGLATTKEIIEKKDS